MLVVDGDFRDLCESWFWLSSGKTNKLDNGVAKRK